MLWYTPGADTCTMDPCITFCSVGIYAPVCRQSIKMGRPFEFIDRERALSIAATDGRKSGAARNIFLAGPSTLLEPAAPRGGRLPNCGRAGPQKCSGRSGRAVRSGSRHIHNRCLPPISPPKRPDSQGRPLVRSPSTIGAAYISGEND